MRGANKQTNAQTAQREALILEIAKRHFFIETLKTCNRDPLNFTMSLSGRSALRWKKQLKRGAPALQKREGTAMDLISTTI